MTEVITAMSCQLMFAEYYGHLELTKIIKVSG